MTEIRTDRLLLRPVRETDVEWAWLQDVPARGARCARSDAGDRNEVSRVRVIR